MKIKFKKILSFLLILLLLIACNQIKTNNNPKESLENYFNLMQEGKYEEASKYTIGEDYPGEDLKDPNNKDFLDFINGFEYEILNLKENEKETKANVKIKYNNMVIVAAAAIDEFTALAFSDINLQSMDEDEVSQYVANIMNEKTIELKDTIEKKEIEFELNMILDNENWKIDLDNDDLVKALTGGIFQTEKN